MPVIKRVQFYDNKNSVDIDASIVADHIVLTATELGLGTLWVCYFDPEVIRKEFNIPDHIEPINILALVMQPEMQNHRIGIKETR